MADKTAGMEPEAVALFKGGEDTRPDGSKKGPGFLGSLKVPGGHATEYSVGTTDVDGTERDIPTLVPTLTSEEIKLMTEDIIPNKKPIPPSVFKKAVEHAKKRIAAGMSPFMGETVHFRKRWREPEE